MIWTQTAQLPAALRRPQNKKKTPICCSMYKYLVDLVNVHRFLGPQVVPPQNDAGSNGSGDSNDEPTTAMPNNHLQANTHRDQISRSRAHSDNRMLGVGVNWGMMIIPERQDFWVGGGMMIHNGTPGTGVSGYHLDWSR